LQFISCREKPGFGAAMVLILFLAQKHSAPVLLYVYFLRGSRHERQIGLSQSKA
jgi:hypothetical protein